MQKSAWVNLIKAIPAERSANHLRQTMRECCTKSCYGLSKSYFWTITC